VGLITFNIGVVVMLLLLKPLGLRIGRPGATTAKAPDTQAPAAMGHSVGPLAVPAIYSAFAVVVVMGLLLGLNNSNLRSYDLVANAAGEPKLSSFLSYPAAPKGWDPSFAAQYDWAKPYFGESSTWYRYTYTAGVGGGGDVHSSLPVFADVINTNNLSSFSAYGVEACYRFHGYSLRNVAQVSLGAGITGQSLSYSTKSHDDWSIVYWIWPVKSGTSTRYERVILYLLNAGDGAVSSPGVAGIKNLRGSLKATDATQRRLIDVRAFLVAFGREIVKNQAFVAPGAQLAKQTPQVQQTRKPFIFRKKFVPTSPGTTPTTIKP
jgi:hypothetical protein